MISGFKCPMTSIKQYVTALDLWNYEPRDAHDFLVKFDASRIFYLTQMAFQLTATRRQLCVIQMEFWHQSANRVRQLFRSNKLEIPWSFSHLNPLNSDCLHTHKNETTLRRRYQKKDSTSSSQLNLPNATLERKCLTILLMTGLNLDLLLSESSTPVVSFWLQLALSQNISADYSSPLRTLLHGNMIQDLGPISDDYDKSKTDG
jgi:hypothetical protein